MLPPTNYAQNYASIIGKALHMAYIMSLLSWLKPPADCGETTSDESDSEEDSIVSMSEVANCESEVASSISQKSPKKHTSHF